MRRVRTRGGRRGGYSGDASFPGAINPNVFAVNRSRLVGIFPEVNYQSAHILLELCEGNVIRAIDNVLYAQDLRKSVLSLFNESRKLAFANSSDEQCNQSEAQEPTEILSIPSSSHEEHIVTQSESLQQEECQSESKQTSPVTDNVSINEELINAVGYITENIDLLPSCTSELPNEILNCELLYDDIICGIVEQTEYHELPEVFQDCTQTQPVPEQQLPQTVVQNQKVNQRAGKVTIGQTTYVMKKLPKDMPLAELSSIAKNPEILEKLVNQPSKVWNNQSK